MTREEALKAWEQMYSEIDKDNWLFVGTINPQMVEWAIKALADRKTEPTISKMEQVEDEPQTEPLQTCSVNGRPYNECSSCEHFRCTADEPQTDCPWK